MEISWGKTNMYELAPFQSRSIPHAWSFCWEKWIMDYHHQIVGCPIYRQTLMLWWKCEAINSHHEDLWRGSEGMEISQRLWGNEGMAGVVFFHVLVCNLARVSHQFSTFPRHGTIKKFFPEKARFLAGKEWVSGWAKWHEQQLVNSDKLSTFLLSNLIQLLHFCAFIIFYPKWSWFVCLSQPWFFWLWSSASQASAGGFILGSAHAARDGASSSRRMGDQTSSSTVMPLSQATRIIGAHFFWGAIGWLFL